ncbi:hypothetical protein SAMN02949497_1811 [Methylomagnum ishizawai]|uniref:Uncharacterized protein n=1 Tax=Methylomagnum ishizawai TaxID=1760988 RepID=A0A1Y6D0X3_9GAMM|nr:hypothetical protein [Methylomagnum ishizawai]SMF94493.1 hypothetical protein SAMN02949497_1811 [Methylomagnum ishizawai]
MPHLIDVEWKDTRFYQEVFAKGEEVGREEGEAVLDCREPQDFAAWLARS